MKGVTAGPPSLINVVLIRMPTSSSSCHQWLAGPSHQQSCLNGRPCMMIIITMMSQQGVPSSPNVLAPVPLLLLIWTLSQRGGGAGCLVLLQWVHKVVWGFCMYEQCKWGANIFCGFIGGGVHTVGGTGRFFVSRLGHGWGISKWEALNVLY